MGDRARENRLEHGEQQQLKMEAAWSEAGKGECDAWER